MTSQTSSSLQLPHSKGQSPRPGLQASSSPATFCLSHTALWTHPARSYPRTLAPLACLERLPLVSATFPPSGEAFPGPSIQPQPTSSHPTSFFTALITPDIICLLVCFLPVFCPWVRDALPAHGCLPGSGTSLTANTEEVCRNDRNITCPGARAHTHTQSWRSGPT